MLRQTNCRNIFLSSTFKGRLQAMSNRTPEEHELPRGYVRDPDEPEVIDYGIRLKSLRPVPEESDS